ncbi:hypothetical protein BGW36DRAFT_363589 [Talaromyces proteolyticus]|uniref:NmrA-like domain-containing protein n=1 Tax=Talaromyces proteolyticus TaxID=1131652 RepID=A0AAD4PVW5_9EURO|nr:uncharacterized protein BGW36DRAFT_363589 [Talaromyces proteolyticus]KAH8691252.1 hypothetical protein BGW36DRAFT_363589 [Talaromyces proteolyticus]
MVIVAVAGGTGHLGRTIVEAIIATKKHDVKIFSRKSNPELESALGVAVIPVDYSDVDSLTKILEDLDIHTVISALSNYNDAEDNSPPEVELIRAADASTTTKRMISSVWSAPYSDRHIGQLSSVTNINNAKLALRKTSDLEYTVFYNGYFMDYWGMPAVPSHMPPIMMVLDIPNDTAVILGSGNVPVTFTHTFDVAKFVAGSLDLDKWDPESYVMGDKVTFNQLLSLAEDAKGTKFSVAFDSIEKLKTGQTTELPAQVPLYSFLPKEVFQYMVSIHGLWLEEGVYDLKPARFLNDHLPQIKPMKVKEILEQAWKRA